MGHHYKTERSLRSNYGKRKPSSYYNKNYDDCDDNNYGRGQKRRKETKKIHKRIYKSSKSVDNLKLRKLRTRKNVKQNICVRPRSKRHITRYPSTDSVIYVGTFYYSYPIIDLTRSDSTLEATLKIPLDKERVLIESNLHGDHNAVTQHMSVVTIRPASDHSLASSASENTIFADEVNNSTIDNNTKNSLNVNIADISRSNLQLHRTYPLNQIHELSPQEQCVECVNANAETFVKEIVNDLPDVVVTVTECNDDNNIERVEGPQILQMDVDKEDETVNEMDVDINSNQLKSAEEGLS